MPAEIVVIHHAAACRYEAQVEEYLAVAEYQREGDRIVFTHTLVPPELRGRGIAEKLVRVALADARAAGYKVVPVCSYVAKFIERNPEYRDLLAG